MTHEEFITEKEELLKLVSKQQEYIELLAKDISDMIGVASVHGYQSRNVLEGVKLRLSMDRLKERLGL